jgi:hypothetical protein
LIYLLNYTLMRGLVGESLTLARFCRLATVSTLI